MNRQSKQDTSGSTGERFLFSLDVADRMRIAGWLIDRQCPEQERTIGFFDEDRLIGSVANSQLSPDLGVAFASDHQLSKFQLANNRFVWTPKHSESFALKNLYIRDLETQVDLMGGRIELPPLLYCVDSPSAAEMCEGGVPEVISGWVANVVQPCRRSQISLFQGERKLASCRASLYRRDLKQNGIGDGFYGFEFALWKVRNGSDLRLIEEQTALNLLP